MQLKPERTLDSLSAEFFLRSINIRYDADYPERIAHFHPTAKSIPLLKALFGLESDKAFFVVAPYGSGKSLTATYLLHLVENQPTSRYPLEKIQSRLEKVSPEIGHLAEKRLSQKDPRGLVLTLHGYCRSLPESLKSAALEAMDRVQLRRQAYPIDKMPCENIEQAIELLQEVKKKAKDANRDRIIIIWDEFGRHLESLLAEGRPAALIEIQMVAEFASRSKDLPMTLGLLLHQGLFNYASNMPQSVRTELKKIEGRFQTIQYIDDSKEIYRLIAEVVSSGSNFKKTLDSSISHAAQECKKIGLFLDFTVTELEELLSQAFPLEPVTLYLLPRLSARVAQNERTLFNFLYNSELSGPIGPEDLYDFFSPAMKSDMAVGGTYRQWLETQSALSKANDKDEVRALKIACLLGLGISGERSRASSGLLLFSLRGYNIDNDEKAIVNNLIDRKLLIHRKYSDEISVWHGTDIDLRGKLEEEKLRHRKQLNLLEFLSKEALPSPWRPLEHNDNYSIHRYLSCEYHTLETLKSYLDFKLELESIPVGTDGKVLYLLSENSDQLKDAEKAVRDCLKNERVIVAIPQEPLPLLEAALEVWCLSQMLVDSDLIGSDPLITPELQQMSDDARGHLQRLLERVVIPGQRGPRWFYRGQEFKAENPRNLRRQLSKIMDTVFGQTPKINNEMIVRHKPSAIVVNSRKKLLLGILERSGQENLGIVGNFPDASMFRTVLLHTKLYHKGEDGRWGYALPSKLDDLRLRAVWEKLQNFLTNPGDGPKNLKNFFEELMEPPFGLRAGLIPILFAAGLKAFPSPLSLRRNGDYVTDILPSEIEQLCREPGQYWLEILDLDQDRINYLRGLLKIFSTLSEDEIKKKDIIRECFDAIEGWKANLPPAALTSKRISEAAIKFRNVINQFADPIHLLFKKIPQACAHSYTDYERLLEVISRCKTELMNVAENYRVSAAASVKRALTLGQQNGDLDLLKIADNWSNCFPESLFHELPEGTIKQFMTRMRTHYESEQFFLDSLSDLLVGKTINRWDDGMSTSFDHRIMDVVRQVEESALSSGAKPENGEMIKTGLAKLIHGKVSHLLDRLVNIIGTEEAEKMLTSILSDRIQRG